MPKKKCPAFDCCILRIRYESMPMKKNELNRHCHGKYEECGRFLMEKMGGMIPGKKPKK